MFVEANRNLFPGKRAVLKHIFKIAELTAFDGNVLVNFDAK